MAEEKRIISVFFVILQSLIYTVFAMDERLDKVKVQCDYLPLINFAIQQNGASIIHQLSIENTTPAPLKDIQVQITTEPTFGNAAPIAVAQIPPNESICLSSFNLTLSANYFTQLTERLSGNLKIEITSEAESVFCQTPEHTTLTAVTLSPNNRKAPDTYTNVTARQVILNYKIYHPKTKLQEQQRITTA